MKSKNTLQKGQVRVIIFKKGKVWFGVALDFSIVETGDDPREIMLILDEAIRGYVASARKAGLRPDVLNQIADKEYEELWRKLENNKPVRSPIQVYHFGRQSLAVA